MPIALDWRLANHHGKPARMLDLAAETEARARTGCAEWMEICNRVDGQMAHLQSWIQHMTEGLRDAGLEHPPAFSIELVDVRIGSSPLYLDGQLPPAELLQSQSDASLLQYTTACSASISRVAQPADREPTGQQIQSCGTDHHFAAQQIVSREAGQQTFSSGDSHQLPGQLPISPEARSLQLPASRTHSELESQQMTAASKLAEAHSDAAPGSPESARLPSPPAGIVQDEWSRPRLSLVQRDPVGGPSIISSAMSGQVQSTELLKTADSRQVELPRDEPLDNEAAVSVNCQQGLLCKGSSYPLLHLSAAHAVRFC